MTGSRHRRRRACPTGITMCITSIMFSARAGRGLNSEPEAQAPIIIGSPGPRAGRGEPEPANELESLGRHGTTDEEYNLTCSHYNVFIGGWSASDAYVT